MTALAFHTINAPVPPRPAASKRPRHTPSITEVVLGLGAMALVCAAVVALRFGAYAALRAELPLFNRVLGLFA